MAIGFYQVIFMSVFLESYDFIPWFIFNIMSNIGTLLIVKYLSIHGVWTILDKAVKIIVLTTKHTNIVWRCLGLAAVLANSSDPLRP